jgi:hypothetical protein
MLFRAWYDASIADFLTADPDAIIIRRYGETSNGFQPISCCNLLIQKPDL